jgi:signal transduction histidine kinase/CheY-like chemotaxis protein
VTDDEETQLRSVALQNAQTILAARQRAEHELRRTKEALEDETRILELLNNTGALLASNLDLESLVQVVTDAGTKVSGAEFGAFFYTVKNLEGGVFTLYALSGARRDAFENLGQPRATPIFAPTFRGEGVIRSGDIREDPRYGQMAPHFGMPAGHLPVCSYLAVPVSLRSGEVIGGLFFGHHDRDVFTARTERILVGIAGQAAIAIDNARLYEATKRAAESERAARAETERVSLMKDEFLATLSHELRTPLSAVLGWAEMLLSRSDPSPDTVRRGLETIVRNARAQSQLIEDLLDMNRIVSGKLRLDVQRTDLSSIIESVLDSVGPAVEAKSIRLRHVLDPNAGPVFGDPHRLQQVVWNLLSNAIKFTPKGGTIEVLLRRVSSHVEIAVIDSGIGISPEFLPYVFERFRQADASITRKHGGLGLGLSIVKQLVELHGGTVRAQSAGIDHGSTFVVCLPVAIVREPSADHPATGRVQAIRYTGRPLEHIKVLLVDDQVDARELLKIILTDTGAEVYTAGSANEGLELLRTKRPDVLVSDIGMPDKDGYQLIREVRRLAITEGGKTPAIALTAFARSEDRTRAMRAGYQVHISKPIEPQELVASIGSLTGRSEPEG